MEFFERHGIKGEIHHFAFRDFEQARNEALDKARQSSLEYDYLLFLDADMELVVSKRDYRHRLDDRAYEVLQRSGISYWNTRMLRRDAACSYRGVTHEYLDVGSQSRCSDISFIDHACGSNRVQKYERDVRLLLAGLAAEPDNARYWFYLAQSYRDSGRWADALEAYGKRATMGGWAEEAWFAVLQQSRCALRQGQDAAFIQLALAAYNLRPTRAEPIYDLARYYREKSMHATSIEFCLIGLSIAWPDKDVLFIEDYVYHYGFKEELSIVGYYSDKSNISFKAYRFCKELAESESVPDETRKLARDNLVWYVEKNKRDFSEATSKQRLYA